PMGKMLIPLLMLMAASIGSGCHCTICGSAEPTRMAVLEASRLPQEQGWAVETNAAPPFEITIEGNALTFNTIGVPLMHEQDPGKAFLWFYREIPIDVSSGFSIVWKLKVHATEQPHNLFDAGIMFYGSIDLSSGTFAEGPRR